MERGREGLADFTGDPRVGRTMLPPLTRELTPRTRECYAGASLWLRLGFRSRPMESTHNQGREVRTERRHGSPLLGRPYN